MANIYAKKTAIQSALQAARIRRSAGSTWVTPQEEAG